MLVTKAMASFGHMVSALVSVSGASGSSPSRGYCVVFLGKTIYFTVPLSILVNAGGTPRRTNISSHNRFRATEYGIISGLLGHLAGMQTLHYLFWSQNGSKERSDILYFQRV